MRNTLHKIIIKWIVPIISLCVGVFLGSTITIIVKKNSSLTISNEIYLMDIISVVVTIILALYVAYIVDKSKSNERTKKDTIILFYKEFAELLKSIINDILDTVPSSQTIRSDFKIIRMRLHNLNEITVSKKIIRTNNPLISQISSELTILWRLCTGDNDIRSLPTNDNIKMSVTKIDYLIDKLILEINDI